MDAHALLDGISTLAGHAYASVSCGIRLTGGQQRSCQQCLHLVTLHIGRRGVPPASSEYAAGREGNDVCAFAVVHAVHTAVTAGRL